MFNWLKRKSPNERQAQAIYHDIMARMRTPKLYEEYGVEDSFDGRFNIMSLHLALRMMTTADEKLRQAMFDVFFGHMETSLREIGIGDMGMPKHMKKMMTAFKGRTAAYAQALEQEKATEQKKQMKEAIKRNVYGKHADEVSAKQVNALLAYTLEAYNEYKTKPQEVSHVA